MKYFNRNQIVRVLAFTSLQMLLLTSSALAAGTQVLDVAKNDSNETCGKYNLKYAKIFLSQTKAEAASGDSIKIVNGNGVAITYKNISADQIGTLEVGLEQAEDQKSESLDLVVRSSTADGKFVTYETVNVPADGKLVRTVNFTKPLKSGNYQVAINCNKSILVPVGFIGGGVALGAIVTAASTNNHHDSPVVIQPETPEVPLVPGNNTPSGTNSNNGSNGSNSSHTPSIPPPNTPSSASP